MSTAQRPSLPRSATAVRVCRRTCMSGGRQRPYTYAGSAEFLRSTCEILCPILCRARVLEAPTRTRTCTTSSSIFNTYKRSDLDQHWWLFRRIYGSLPVAGDSSRLHSKGAPHPHTRVPHHNLQHIALTRRRTWSSPHSLRRKATRRRSPRSSLESRSPTPGPSSPRGGAGRRPP